MLFNFPYKLSGRLYVRGNLRLVGLEEQIVVCIVTHDDEVGEQRAILTSKNTSTDVVRRKGSIYRDGSSRLVLR